MLADDEAGTLKRIPDSVQALIAARIDGLGGDREARAPARGARRPRVLARRARRALAGPRRRLRARQAARARVRHARGALVDLGRAGVPLHARPDPRGRLRHAHQGAPRRGPHHARRLGRRARAGRAGRHPRLPPRPRRDARRRARGRRRRPSSCTRPPAALEGAGRRALRRGSFADARTLSSRAVELEPTRQAPLLRRAGGRRASPTSRPRATRRSSVLEDARAEGDRRVEGRALVLLAEIALRADSDVACATELADEALEALPEDDLHGLYDARTLLATIAWWVGDAEAARRHGDGDGRARAGDRAPRPREPRAHAPRRRRVRRRATTRGGARADRARDRARARERQPRGARLGAGDGRPLRDRRRRLRPRPRPGCARGSRCSRRRAPQGRAGWAKAMLAALELRRGNVERAEELLRDAMRRLRATQEHGFLVEAERTLAEVLVAQGRVTEAERVAEHARKTVGARGRLVARLDAPRARPRARRAGPARTRPRRCCASRSRSSSRRCTALRPGRARLARRDEQPAHRRGGRLLVPARADPRIGPPVERFGGLSRGSSGRCRPSRRGSGRRPGRDRSRCRSCHARGTGASRPRPPCGRRARS